MPPPDGRGPRGSLGKIFIGGLGKEMEDEELKSIFESLGEVIDWVIIRDRETRQSRGFGFITYKNPDIARVAIQKMNNTEVHGRTINVVAANAREGEDEEGRPFERRRPPPQSGHYDERPSPRDRYGEGRPGGDRRPMDYDRQGGERRHNPDYPPRRDGPPPPRPSERPPPHFGDRPPPPRRDERGGPPPSRFDERGPPPRREERGPPPPGPRYDDRGPPPPRREERGPPPPGPRYDERGPPPPRREERGPPPPGPRYDERGPPPPRREERGPPPQARPDPSGRPRFDERGPPPSRFEDRGPTPSARYEERGPPPGSRFEERGPLPVRPEERGPPPSRLSEPGPPPARSGPPPSRYNEGGSAAGAPPRYDDRGPASRQEPSRAPPHPEQRPPPARAEPPRAAPSYFDQQRTEPRREERPAPRYPDQPQSGTPSRGPPPSSLRESPRDAPPARSSYPGERAAPEQSRYPDAGYERRSAPQERPAESRPAAGYGGGHPSSALAPRASEQSYRNPADSYGARASEPSRAPGPRQALPSAPQSRYPPSNEASRDPAPRGYAEERSAPARSQDYYTRNSGTEYRAPQAGYSSSAPSRQSPGGPSSSYGSQQDQYRSPSSTGGARPGSYGAAYGQSESRGY